MRAKQKPSTAWDSLPTAFRGEANKAYEQYKQPLSTGIADRTRPELERLAAIVGSKAKKDIRFVRGIAHKNGALVWAKKQGLNREGKPKYMVYDDDVDDDGVPEVVIRDAKGNLYAMNGYRTTKSDMFTRNMYLDTHPTRALRKEEPYQDWLDTQIGAQDADEYGLTREATNQKFIDDIPSGYKAHFSPTVSVLKAFTKKVVKPILERELLAYYNRNKAACNEYFADPTKASDDDKVWAARKRLQLLPLATSAIANKAFFQIINIPLLQLYKAEFGRIADNIVAKYHENNWSNIPQGPQLAKEAFKRLSSKKGFKEAQTAMYKQECIDNDPTRQEIKDIIKPIIQEAYNADSDTPFVNIWEEQVRVRETMPQTDPFTGLKTKDYTDYIGDISSIADTVRGKRKGIFNVYDYDDNDPDAAVRSKFKPTVTKGKRVKPEEVQPVPVDEYSDDNDDDEM